MFKKDVKTEKLEKAEFKPTVLWQGSINFPKGFYYNIRIVQADEITVIMEAKDPIPDSLGNERWYQITNIYRGN